MPWPEKVIHQFQTIPPNPIECDFYGAYNKLLNTLFPPDTDFTVVPWQYIDIGNPQVPWQDLDLESLKPFHFDIHQDIHQDIRQIVAFEVVLENKPVFFLELKKPTDLASKSSRQAADMEIREDLVNVASQLRTLWRG